MFEETLFLTAGAGGGKDFAAKLELLDACRGPDTSRHQCRLDPSTSGDLLDLLRSVGIVFRCAAHGLYLVSFGSLKELCPAFVSERFSDLMLKFLYQDGTGLHLDVARALVLPRELPHLFPTKVFQHTLQCCHYRVCWGPPVCFSCLFESPHDANEPGCYHWRQMCSCPFCHPFQVSCGSFEFQILLAAALSSVTEGAVVTQPYDATEFARVRTAT